MDDAWCKARHDCSLETSLDMHQAHPAVACSTFRPSHARMSLFSSCSLLYRVTAASGLMGLEFGIKRYEVEMGMMLPLMIGFEGTVSNQ
jgi:hypothetical protein